MAHLRRLFEECVFARRYSRELVPDDKAFNAYHQLELLQARQPVRVYDRQTTLVLFRKKITNNYISKFPATKGGHGQRRRD